MSFGKMNTFIEIVTTTPIKDAEAFTNLGDVTLANVRAYFEERHGNELWANRAVFSNATALFRFRKIPGLVIDTKLVIICEGARYQILSVEDIKGRGMYYEVLADKTEPSKRG